MMSKKNLYLFIACCILYGLHATQKGTYQMANAGQRAPYAPSFDLSITPQTPNILSSEDKIEGLSANLSEEDVVQILKSKGYEIQKQHKTAQVLHAQAGIVEVEASRTHQLDEATPVEEQVSTFKETSNIKYTFSPNNISTTPPLSTTVIELKKNYFSEANSIKTQSLTTPNTALLPTAPSPSTHHSVAFYEHSYANEINDMINQYCHPALDNTNTLCAIDHERVEIRHKQMLSTHDENQYAELIFEAYPTQILKTVSITTTK